MCVPDLVSEFVECEDSPVLVSGEVNHFGNGETGVLEASAVAVSWFLESRKSAKKNCLLMRHALILVSTALIHCSARHFRNGLEKEADHAYKLPLMRLECF